MNARQWCIQNGVLHLADSLARALAADGVNAMQMPAESDGKGSEARQQALVRLEAAQKDILCWRNNVGALPDRSGRIVRYGLANESSAMNAVLKSADLIMLRKVFISPVMVGSYIGQFVAREMKEEGWTFNPKDSHEVAQQTFLNLVNSYGGDAQFCTKVGSL